MKLTAKKRVVIKNIKKSPVYYEVGGNCCWKVYDKTYHRGKDEVLRGGADRQKNMFTIKSVKLVACE